MFALVLLLDDSLSKFEFRVQLELLSLEFKVVDCVQELLVVILLTLFEWVWSAFWTALFFFFLRLKSLL